MNVNVGGIPAELREIDRWVLWRYEDRNGKRTKPPFQVNGRRADVSKPKTWTTFDLAHAALKNGGGFEGVGLVLDGSDERVAWDLDHCLDPKNLKITDERIEHIVRTLASYTEVTPSGEGLRVLTRGRLPRDGTKRGNVEAYQKGRYVTVTGRRWGDVAEIRPHPPGAYDEAFPEPDAALARALRDPATRKLYDGEWSGDFPSQSEADLALCRRLLAYGDAPKVDGWFRRSKLFRPKWDQRHGEHTYGQLTLRKAAELGAAEKPPGELVVVGADEFARMEFPPREYILAPWLQAKNLAMIYGHRGVGKTLLGVGCALAAAAGGEFLGWKAERAIAVLYVDGELPQETLQRRIRDVAAAAKVPVSARLRLLTPDRQDAQRIPNLADEKGQQILDACIEREDPGLIVLDNLSTLVRSGEENAAESWQVIQDWIVLQRSRRRSVLMIHHAGKSGAQRGTSKREDVLDVSIEVKRPGDYHPEEGARFELHFKKARDHHGSAVAAFEARLEEGAWTVKSIEAALRDRILALVAEGMKPREIAEEVRASYSYVYRVKKGAESGTLFTGEM